MISNGRFFEPEIDELVPSKQYQIVATQEVGRIYYSFLPHQCSVGRIHASQVCTFNSIDK